MRRARLAIALGDSVLEVKEIAWDAPTDLAREHISSDPSLGCHRAAGTQFQNRLSSSPGL
jgi:hypothetical protein